MQHAKTRLLSLKWDSEFLCYSTRGCLKLLFDILFMLLGTLPMADSWYRTGNLPKDSALVCINIDISPEMAAQSTQRNQAFCVTASHWSPITTA